MKASRDFSTLVEIMSRLRDPETGCPWDVEQDFKSIAPYTIEEAYEVADAIERKDYEDLCSELGDLLLQPVFHAQMASEANLFDMGDVIEGICEKLIRRHPHVFASKSDLSSGAVLAQWEDIKAEERRLREESRERRGLEKPQTLGQTPEQTPGQTPPSLLDDVAVAMPALARAEKLAKRVARIGFDWPDLAGVLAKCREELGEVEAEIAAGDQDRIDEEIGDLLFAVANLARKAGISPEAALSDANRKFIRRFQYVEQRCAKDNIEPEKAGLDQLQAYWDEVREAEKSAGDVRQP